MPVETPTYYNFLDSFLYNTSVSSALEDSQEAHRQKNFHCICKEKSYFKKHHLQRHQEICETFKMSRENELRNAHIQNLIENLKTSIGNIITLEELSMLSDENIARFPNILDTVRSYKTTHPDSVKLLKRIFSTAFIDHEEAILKDDTVYIMRIFIFTYVYKFKSKIKFYRKLRMKGKP